MIRLRALLRSMGMASLVCLAGAAAPASGPSAGDSAVHSPLLPPRLLWPGVAVIVVIAIFVTAALAGPLIRANMRDELPGEQKRDDSAP